MAMAVTRGSFVVVDDSVPERRISSLKKCFCFPHTGMAIKRCQGEKFPAWRKTNDTDTKGLRDYDGRE